VPASDSAPRPRPGRLTYLSDADKTAIYEGALEIIGSVGMRVLHPEALELLRAAGCSVQEPDLVRIPRELVEQARSTAPAVVEVYDRAGEPAMSLGRHNSYFGTGSDLMSTYDLETGEHRPSCLADVARAARLCDALPNIDFVMSCAHPNDIEPARSYLESFNAMVANTTKPMVMTSEHAGDLAVMCAVAEALRGGPEELAAKPYFTMYLEPVSPLSHPVESIDKLLFCADHGIPAIYSPAPLAGGTAPITVAGHTCQGVAESLFGLVIHQLRKPGAPFLFGIGPAVLDMATSQSSYNAPEYPAQLGLRRHVGLAGRGRSGGHGGRGAGVPVSGRRIQPEPRRGVPGLRPHGFTRAHRHRRRVHRHEPQALRRRRGDAGDARRRRRARRRPRRRLPGSSPHRQERA